MILTGFVPDDDLVYLYQPCVCPGSAVAAGRIRPAGRRGDGLRHAGHLEPGRLAAGGRRRGGRLLRPDRRRLDRRRDPYASGRRPPIAMRWPAWPSSGPRSSPGMRRRAACSTASTSWRASTRKPQPQDRLTQLDRTASPIDAVTSCPRAPATDNLGENGGRAGRPSSSIASPLPRMLTS